LTGVLSRHLHDAPVPPTERVPELAIPAGMSRIVMRALRKRPIDRFQRASDLQAELVEELRAAGSNSVESLLDPGRMRRLAGLGAAPATRDDVDAYERKLRRKRYGAMVTGVALLSVGAALGASALWPRPARYSGVEIEPNNSAAEATPLQLGSAMTGQIGRRIDATHGDRDFYSFDLQGDGALAHLHLRLSPLPSMALCALLYQPGVTEPLGRYCQGRPGRALSIPALALPPGRYLLAVVQDLDAHGGGAPYVQESISDSYTVIAERATPTPEVEIEPNDGLASATQVALGAPVRATLGWARDEDVFCVPGGVKGPVRFRVRATYREGAPLEAAVRTAAGVGRLVWIHPGIAERRSERDVESPWVSASLPDAGEPRCLEVRHAADPWAKERVGGDESYVVEVEPG
jgi:serine/threonine-protein kinase